MAQLKSPRSLLAFAPVLYPGRCLASQAAAVKPLGAGALGSKLRPFSSSCELEVLTGTLKFFGFLAKVKRFAEKSQGRE